MTQKLTALEHKAAANALIEWFRTQDLGPEDASLVMQKVWAKIIIDGTTDLKEISPIMRALQLNLSEEMGKYFHKKHNGR